jgi:pimeloyl-ACP methyl ester carboxylesterase
MTTLRWAVLYLVLFYAAAVAALYAFQRVLLYPIPQTARTTPAAAGFPEAEELVATTRDGEQVILWHVPPKADRPVVIFFHGNGEVLAWRVPRFRALTADGTGLVALSFRGYGGSTGRPTEQGLFDDGAAAYDFAAARYSPARIVPWGYSLGSGVAIVVATTGPVGAVVLEAPYTSIVDVAAGAFPFFPVRWLMRDRFHSDQRIGALKAPLLIMHGEKDSVIAAAFGRQLYELAPGRKRFVAFDHGTHIDFDEQGAVATARAFLEEIRQTRE